MKKLIMALVGAFLLVAGAAAQSVEAPVAIDFPFNEYAGAGVIEYQAKVNWLSASNSYAAKKGDKITFHIEGKTQGKFSDVKAVLCDTRQEVKWWREKSDYQVIPVNAADGKAFSVDLTFTVKENVEAAEPRFCQLILMLGEPATWTVTKFTAKKL